MKTRNTKAEHKYGIEKATQNIIKEMLKNKMDDGTIKKITKIKTEELEKIKKEMLV